MPKVSVLTMDDSGTLILPDVVLDRLKAKVGDDLVLTETARGYHIRRHDPDSEDPADARTRAD